MIADHYSSSKDPLLLSQLGQKLKNLGVWPIPGEERPLAHLLSEIDPPVDIIRDSVVGSYAVVFPPDFRHIAEQAINFRSTIRYLRELPRVVLLAFCVDGSSNSVFLNSQRPYDYLVNPEHEDPNYILIDDSHRIPGLYIGNVSTLPSASAEELASKIQSWSSSNHVDFIRRKTTRDLEERILPTPSPKPSAKRIAGSALDRLYDAQRPDVALAMNIPLDIAQLLSRIP